LLDALQNLSGRSVYHYAYAKDFQRYSAEKLHFELEHQIGSLIRAQIRMEANTQKRNYAAERRYEDSYLYYLL